MSTYFYLRLHVWVPKGRLPTDDLVYYHAQTPHIQPVVLLLVVHQLWAPVRLRTDCRLPVYVFPVVVRTPQVHDLHLALVVHHVLQL